MPTPANLSDELKTKLIAWEAQIKKLHEEKDHKFSEVLTQKEAPTGAVTNIGRIEVQAQLQAESDKLRPKVEALQECLKLLQIINAAPETDKPFHLKKLDNYLKNAIDSNKETEKKNLIQQLKSKFLAFFINKIFPTLEKLKKEINALYKDFNSVDLKKFVEKPAAAPDIKASPAANTTATASAAAPAPSPQNKKQADAPSVSTLVVDPVVKKVIEHPLLQSTEYKAAHGYVYDEKRTKDCNDEECDLSNQIQQKQSAGVAGTDPILVALINKRTALKLAFDNPKRLLSGIKDLLENHEPGNAAKSQEHEKNIKTACGDVTDSKANHERTLYHLTREYFRDQKGDVGFRKVNGFMFNKHFRKTDAKAYAKAKSDKHDLKDYSQDPTDYSDKYSAASVTSHTQMMAGALSRPPNFQNGKVPASDEPVVPSASAAAPATVKAPAITAAAPTATAVAELPQNRV